MGRDDPAGGSNLPAPYRNPWFALADDLRAALADLGLRVRELRRRNGDGSLWRPGWWPAGLAPLFWPLLLALTLAVLVGLALGSTQLLRHQPVPAPSTPDTALSRANEPVAASPDRVEPTAPDPEPAAPTPSLEASKPPIQTLPLLWPIPWRRCSPLLRPPAGSRLPRREPIRGRWCSSSRRPTGACRQQNGSGWPCSGRGWPQSWATSIWSYAIPVLACWGGMPWWVRA